MVGASQRAAFGNSLQDMLNWSQFESPIGWLPTRFWGCGMKFNPGRKRLVLACLTGFEPCAVASDGKNADQNVVLPDERLASCRIQR